MYAKRHKIDITTVTGGSAIAYTSQISGQLVSIQYVKDDFTDGVDFDITTETTEKQLWKEDNVNASKTVYPTEAANNTVGGARLFAGAGEAVPVPICIAQERIKIAISSGGDAKKGIFHIMVAGPTG